MHKIERADQCCYREKNHKDGQNNGSLTAALFVFRFETFAEDQIENGHDAALHQCRQDIKTTPGVKQIFHRKIHIRIINVRMAEAAYPRNRNKKCDNDQQQPGKCKRFSAEIKNCSDGEQNRSGNKQKIKNRIQKIKLAGIMFQQVIIRIIQNQKQQYHDTGNMKNPIGMFYQTIINCIFYPILHCHSITKSD